MTLAKDLKKGDIITLDNQPYTVEKVDVSKIAKHGKAKCRVETVTKTGEKKVFIFPADHDISKQ